MIPIPNRFLKKGSKSNTLLNPNNIKKKKIIDACVAFLQYSDTFMCWNAEDEFKELIVDQRFSKKNTKRETVIYISVVPLLALMGIASNYDELTKEDGEGYSIMKEFQQYSRNGNGKGAARIIPLRVCGLLQRKVLLHAMEADLKSWMSIEDTEPFDDQAKEKDSDDSFIRGRFPFRHEVTRYSDHTVNSEFNFVDAQFSNTLSAQHFDGPYYTAEQAHQLIYKMVVKIWKEALFPEWSKETAQREFNIAMKDFGETMSAVITKVESQMGTNSRFLQSDDSICENLILDKISDCLIKMARCKKSLDKVLTGQTDAH